ncbi:hypothetical protein [Streptomyces sp. BF23-19]
MAFANEPTVVGTVDDMSERTLLRLHRWLRDLDQFSKVRYRIQKAGLRLRANRLGR